MGTNFYAQQPGCHTCGRTGERIHIGKSSVGWCFGLHVVPEKGLNGLEEWKTFLSSPSVTIEDEYGTVIPLERLLVIITDRRSESRPLTAEWLRLNHAERGPNNLARHRIDRYCVAHGEGTYDLLVGEFF